MNEENEVDAVVMRLCYVDGAFAYFTSQDVKTQWGDDWNDAPYEHNAGEPYEWRKESDEKEYQIKKVAFESDMETPEQLAGCNSVYSVEMINSGAVAWLASSTWTSKKFNVMAGSTMEEFESIVLASGGAVYKSA